MNKFDNNPFIKRVGPSHGGLQCVDVAGLCSGRDKPLPYSLRVVLENTVRSGQSKNRKIISQLVDWSSSSGPLDVALDVSRVIFPDSSGLPALMDFAALRDVLVQKGLDPGVVEPVIPCDLVIDHSLIVDHHGNADAEALNIHREFERNHERYVFFKWAQQAFSNLNVVPPGMGIIHQIHLEYLAKVVAVEGDLAFPEFILGCDSHTPMVNALGVLGWGVGGIDAQSALIGEPYRIRIPGVVGVRFIGRLKEGVTTTDLVLLLTERLRKAGVVGDFVEFTGSALNDLSVPERATLSNMAPEYGATCGYFPIDAMTIEYLKETGRDPAHVKLVEQVTKAVGLFRDLCSPEPEFTRIIDIDLSSVESSIAGPFRPQDRLPLSRVPDAFRELVSRNKNDGGFSELPHKKHGVLAIAAITSCTNTSNPSVMLGAGMLARNAVAKGLRTPEYVKTSLAPGSRVVTAYLESANLINPLEKLGFFNVGYGCTTCSGKSGPINPDLEEQIVSDSLVACAVLSGNRNFEGRIHKSVRANYISSPMLVVAYALAGRIDINFDNEPLGFDKNQQPVFLKDVWPSDEDISECFGGTLDADSYVRNYANIFKGTSNWKKLKTPSGYVFNWSKNSTYIKRPPFFDDDFQSGRGVGKKDVKGARVLCRFGNSFTTDHITPSGEIPVSSQSGAYLLAQGVEPRDFNAYTMRRGNHEVLSRATFANQRVRNLLVKSTLGGVTHYFPENIEMPIYEAAQKYLENSIPVIVFAGRDYGMGSSRDWAAKGQALLGVKIVIAESFERIHRSNLVGMGILPAVFRDNESFDGLGLTGRETYEFEGICAAINHDQDIQVTAIDDQGHETKFLINADLFGIAERNLLLKGGIFPEILDQFLADKSKIPAMPVGEYV